MVGRWSVCRFKTSQELRMLSSVTINCQATKILMNLFKNVKTIKNCQKLSKLSEIVKINKIVEKC